MVFGSVARGDFNLWSDIDVLVVADNLPERWLDRLGRLAPLGKNTAGDLAASNLVVHHMGQVGPPLPVLVDTGLPSLSAKLVDRYRRLSAEYTVLYVSRRDAPMRTMTYSESRAKYAETLNAVVDDREEVVITRAGHDPVVIVSLDDYEALKEAAYLLRSPENARRLLASIDRLEAGGGIERDICE